MMISDSQVLYDGSNVTNCNLKNVIIQMSLTAPQAPIFKLNMDMDCSNGISIFVYDLTFELWNQFYNLISASATDYKYYTAIPGWPFDAVEFKLNWTTSDSFMRFFHGNDTTPMDPQNITPGIAVFNAIMNSAIQDVQNNAIPGVKYLCSQCGSQADWKGEKYALAWKFTYNTINTVVSIYALIIFFLTLSEKDKLPYLLEYIGRWRARDIDMMDNAKWEA
ncbi:hypothetical protein BGX26_011856 [Mortierella sp. AD094]|nr:hypothetical protein BGX26_011856 [Mortierella sp. AD094]